MGQAALNLNPDVSAIVERLLYKDPVSRNELKQLLSLTNAEDIELLFAAARQARSSYFGNRIFLYGFLYFSTYCRNDCSFCQYRKSNTHLFRYRKNEAVIRDAAKVMAASGIHLIDLTMGEDPYMFSAGSSPMKHFGDIVMAVRRDTELPIMISPGVIPKGILTHLAQAGIEWYACYQETHNKDHFQRLRGSQSYATRLARKRQAKSMGMLIEEGILLGTGESLDDIVDSMYFMQRENVDQIRAMTFIPQNKITIDRLGADSSLSELLAIAAMRLMMPDRLIPASLDVDGLDGLEARLNAGANVITSIVPPDKGLAGVVNKSLDIEDSRRSIDQIAPIMKKCGLKVASQHSYREWIASRRIGGSSSAPMLVTSE